MCLLLSTPPSLPMQAHAHIEMTRLSQGCHNSLVTNLWQPCDKLETTLYLKLSQPCDNKVVTKLCCMLLGSWGKGQAKRRRNHNTVAKTKLLLAGSDWIAVAGSLPTTAQSGPYLAICIKSVNYPSINCCYSVISLVSELVYLLGVLHGVGIPNTPPLSLLRMGHPRSKPDGTARPSALPLSAPGRCVME